MTRRTFISFTKHRMAKPGRLISFACCDPESRAKGKRRYKTSIIPGQKTMAELGCRSLRTPIRKRQSHPDHSRPHSFPIGHTQPTRLPP